MSVGATYVYKEGRDFLGWTDVGGIYGTQTVTLPDGQSLEVLPLLNAPSARRFLLTNPEEYYLQYRGLLLTFQRRWARGVQALVSYSNSEAKGLQIYSMGSSSAIQSSATLGSTLGSDPNALTDAEGILPDDRTHMFRVQGSAEIPKVGVLVGANFQYLTGKSWSARTLQRLPQGTQPIYIEPRGARRFDSQTLFDLRISKRFHFGRGASVEVLADLLNVLDETAEEGIVTDNYFSSNFAAPNLFVDPRRVMLGVRFAF
jgi:hypothetical protein